MKKILLAGVAGLVLVGSTAVYAQQRGWHHHHHARMAPEDRAAFLDARIAAVHAGLKLNADQEKLWSPLEGAVRDFVKLRTDRANARMQDRDARGPDARGPDAKRPEFDPVARLRQRAETMSDNGAALKKIADAADPLYKTLDDGQKRRLMLLTHLERGMGPRHEFGPPDRDFSPSMRGPRGDDRGVDRGPRGGPDREFRRGPDRDDDRGPSRL